MSESAELGETDNLAQIYHPVAELVNVRDDLQSAEDKASALRLRRDELIVALSGEGKSLREIAKVAGMSYQGVDDVVKKARREGR
jgi:DNA-directed RNA polymerase specialized sigma24 family protein